MSIVLEEDFDENYEPTAEEIQEYAAYIGLNSETEPHLLWIARSGLKAPLPKDWKPCQSENGAIYYFNFASGESIWEHPCDNYYINLYKEEKAKNPIPPPGWKPDILFKPNPPQLKTLQNDKNTESFGIKSPVTGHLMLDTFRAKHPSIPPSSSPTSPHFHSESKKETDMPESSIPIMVTNPASAIRRASMPFNESNENIRRASYSGSKTSLNNTAPGNSYPNPNSPSPRRSRSSSNTKLHTFPSENMYSRSLKELGVADKKNLTLMIDTNEESSKLKMLQKVNEFEEINSPGFDADLREKRKELQQDFEEKLQKEKIELENIYSEKLNQMKIRLESEFKEKQDQYQNSLEAEFKVSTAKVLTELKVKAEIEKNRMMEQHSLELSQFQTMLNEKKSAMNEETLSNDLFKNSQAYHQEIEKLRDELEAKKEQFKNELNLFEETEKQKWSLEINEKRQNLVQRQLQEEQAQILDMKNSFAEKIKEITREQEKQKLEIEEMNKKEILELEKFYAEKLNETEKQLKHKISNLVDQFSQKDVDIERRMTDDKFLISNLEEDDQKVRQQNIIKANEKLKIEENELKIMESRLNEWRKNLDKEQMKISKKQTELDISKTMDSVSLYLNDENTSTSNIPAPIIDNKEHNRDSIEDLIISPLMSYSNLNQNLNADKPNIANLGNSFESSKEPEKYDSDFKAKLFREETQMELSKKYLDTQREDIKRRHEELENTRKKWIDEMEEVKSKISVSSSLEDLRDKTNHNDELHRIDSQLAELLQTQKIIEENTSFLTSNSPKPPLITLEDGTENHLNNVENHLSKVISTLRTNTIRPNAKNIFYAGNSIASNRQYKPAFNKSLNASSVLERNRNIDKYSSKTKINPTPLTQFQQWDNNRKQSEHLMKDHQHWLQKFRQEIGLERTGTSFSRRPGL